MINRIFAAATTAILIIFGIGSAVQAQQIDFGDNASRWAGDGVCDDPRFEGPGMVDTPPMEADRGHDATDCGKAFKSGQIWLKPEVSVYFGDDASRWANDNECDDLRFEGPGMTTTPLLDQDIGHDATDCQTAFDAGQLQFVGGTGTIEFGDDSSQWANDDECDDPAFEGPGTAETLLESDRMRDATDCYNAMMAGTIVPVLEANISFDGIEFGDDSSQWANDGECDDPRFEGPGVADTLLDSDLGRDASDCSMLYQDGSIWLADEGSSSSSGGTVIEDGIVFGDNSSQWANDNECDDPRFEGPGTAETLLDSDLGRDADDCLALYQSGSIWLKGSGNSGDKTSGGLNDVGDNVDFGDDASMWSGDNECDDPRFEGPGMTDTPLLDSDIGHDATDCRTAFENGSIWLR